MNTRLVTRHAAALLAGAFLSTILAETPIEPDMVQFADVTFEVSEVHPDWANWRSFARVRFEIQRGSSAEVGGFRVEVTGGTATRDVDYRIERSEWQSCSHCDQWGFEIIDDGIHEPDETIELTLRDPSGNVVFGPRTKTTVTIRNSPPTFSVQPYDFHGMDEPLGERFGAVTYPVVIERRGDRDTAASVRVRVAGGREVSGEPGFPAATTGVDFLPFDERVHFASGETNRIVELGIPDDGLVEGNKWITLELTEPSGGVLHPHNAAWETGLNDNEAATHLDVRQSPLPLPLQFEGLSLDAPLITPSFRPVGSSLELDNSFPPLRVQHEAAGFGARFDPFKQEMIVSRAYTINGVLVPYYSSHVVRLVGLPETALQMGAFSWSSPNADLFPPNRISAEVNWSPPPSHVLFRRLGPSTAPATVHYTTRDYTAKAGEDYVAQSGTLTFAPLEVEKVIELAGTLFAERQFNEEFEIVVTSAEGIVELPAPLRVRVDNGLPLIPELNRIRRLPDGRVLLDGRGEQENLEYSTDLKTWLPLTGLPSAWDSGFRLWLDASATNAPTRYYRVVAR